MHQSTSRWHAIARLTTYSLIGLFALTAALALVWTPYAVDSIDIANMLAPPSSAHWLGTDQLGRDILSRIMVGSHSALLVALGAVAIGAIIGVPLGLVSAARPGLTDDALMYFSDFMFAFPALLVAAMLAALYGPSLVNAILAIGIFNIPVFARITRAAARVIWPAEYILAARAMGLSLPHILWRHIIPNMAGILVVQITVQLTLAILAEAGLSYLGLSAPPETPSWGRMLFEAQSLIYIAPHTILAPGLMIFIVVLGLNLFGDHLRDKLNHRPTLYLAI